MRLDTSRQATAEIWEEEAIFSVCVGGQEELLLSRSR